MVNETPEGPFLVTAGKYNAEHASGKLPRSKFPYDEIQSLPGYSERCTPGITKSDITRELAGHLMDYAESKGDPLQYGQRDIGHYLWWQAERDMLDWTEVFKVVWANRKRNRYKESSRYFGYTEVLGPDGKADYRRLFRLIRYITQEGICAGCDREFSFNLLTLDRIKPRAWGGKYELSNVQVMCAHCNNAVKRDNYDERHE